MTAIVQALSRWSLTETKTKTTTATDTDALTIIALLCGAGLFVFMMFASYGLDLGPGFF